MAAPILAATLLVLSAAPASGQAEHIVPLAEGWRLEMAPLPTSHSAESLAVSGPGLVVGDQRYGNAFHGFRWDPATGRVELTDVGPARAVDDQGRAVVGMQDLQRWEVDGSFSLLPVPDPPPAASAWAVRMSPAGWIVADMTPGDTVVVWDPSLAVSVRTGIERVDVIDDLGRVAGTTSGGAYVVLGPDGTVTPSPSPPALDLGGGTYFFTEGRSPSGTWSAIGLFDGNDSWPGVGPTLEDARRLSCGEGARPTVGRARAVNDEGLVVGGCQVEPSPTQGDYRAVAWLPPPPPPPTEATDTTVPPMVATDPSRAEVAVPVRATPRFTG